MGNITIPGNRSRLSAIEELLSARLPTGWTVRSTRGRSGAEGDAALEIRAPGCRPAVVPADIRSRVEPKDVAVLAAELGSTVDRPVLVVAPFLSPRTRELLRRANFAFADPTGNLRLSLAGPVLFVETHGADENPAPAVRDRRSLKGAKAGRLVRALCDFRPPLGVRELATRADVDAGYASRVVGLLSREALVAREPRGPIRTVDWPALLRRWSTEYSPFRRDRVSWFLAARGLNAVIERLRTVRLPYAVSGAWAAAQSAPVAPPRLVLCYTESPQEFAKALDIRPTDSGANVALALPFDRVVFERTAEKKGVTVAAVSQVAADLLTSPGRGPNEAEALIDWMSENEDVWRR